VTALNSDEHKCNIISKEKIRKEILKFLGKEKGSNVSPGYEIVIYLAIFRTILEPYLIPRAKTTDFIKCRSTSFILVSLSFSTGQFSGR